MAFTHRSHLSVASQSAEALETGGTKTPFRHAEFITSVSSILTSISPMRACRSQNASIASLVRTLPPSSGCSSRTTAKSAPGEGREMTVHRWDREEQTGGFGVAKM